MLGGGQELVDGFAGLFEGFEERISGDAADDWIKYEAQAEGDIASKAEGFDFEIDTAVAFFKARDAGETPDVAVALIDGQAMLNGATVIVDLMNLGGS